MLLTLVQFAANPHRVRTSLPSYIWTPDLLPASPPRAGAGGWPREAVRSTLPAPRHLTSPLLGVEGDQAGLAGCQLTYPAPRLTPRHLTDRAGWEDLPPTPHPSASPRSPTWASVARGDVGACVVEPTCTRQQPAVTAADFTALYDRCTASSLKAWVVFSHTAGNQVLTVTCNIPAPTVTSASAGRHCRGHRRHQGQSRVATAAPNAPARATLETLLRDWEGSDELLLSHLASQTLLPSIFCDHSNVVSTQTLKRDFCPRLFIIRIVLPS